MNQFSKRDLLRSAALVAGAGALGGCAATGPLAAGSGSTEPAASGSGVFPTPAGPIALPPARALDPAQTITRIACGSCWNQARDGKLFDTVIRAQPDLFVFMGDNVYGDVSSAELDELYAAYAGALVRPDYRRFRSAMPMLATWDDHDYGDNDEGGRFVHKEKTRALFHDFWGVPAESPGRGRDGVWDAVTLGPAGRRVQIILLDLRSHRDDWTATDQKDAPGKERYLPNSDSTKTILGPAQWAWLEAQLKEPADLRVLVSSYQLVVEAHGWERWGLFPAERQRFYDLVARTGANHLFVLSGDRHFSAIYRESNGAPYPIYELTASSMNMPITGWSTRAEEPGPNRLGPTYRDMNFGLARIDWDARRVGLEVQDKDGRAVLSHAFSMDELRRG